MSRLDSRRGVLLVEILRGPNRLEMKEFVCVCVCGSTSTQTTVIMQKEHEPLKVCLASQPQEDAEGDHGDYKDLVRLSVARHSR